MRIEINIQNRHLMIIILFIAAISAVGLVVAYNSGGPPSLMGHTWEEMECSGCITGSNLADNAVTSSKIQDGSITNNDISATAAIDGSKITGTVPDAQTINNTAIGTTLYTIPSICGDWGITTSATCSTACCTEYAGTCYYYYTCGGSCNILTYPATCSTTYLGRLLE